MVPNDVALCRSDFNLISHPPRIDFHWADGGKFVKEIEGEDLWLEVHDEVESEEQAFRRPHSNLFYFQAQKKLGLTDNTLYCGLVVAVRHTIDNTKFSLAKIRSSINEDQFVAHYYTSSEPFGSYYFAKKKLLRKDAVTINSIHVISVFESLSPARNKIPKLYEREIKTKLQFQPDEEDDDDDVPGDDDLIALDEEIKSSDYDRQGVLEMGLAELDLDDGLEPSSVSSSCSKTLLQCVKRLVWCLSRGSKSLAGHLGTISLNIVWLYCSMPDSEQMRLMAPTILHEMLLFPLSNLKKVDTDRHFFQMALAHIDGKILDKRLFCPPLAILPWKTDIDLRCQRPPRKRQKAPRESTVRQSLIDSVRASVYILFSSYSSQTIQSLVQEMLKWTDYRKDLAFDKKSCLTNGCLDFIYILTHVVFVRSSFGVCFDDLFSWSSEWDSLALQLAKFLRRVLEHEKTEGGGKKHVRGYHLEVKLELATSLLILSRHSKDVVLGDVQLVMDQLLADASGM